jgi:6-phosphofructokinase 1
MEMKKLYGNAVVGQSGGPTAAINATLAGVVRGALECEYIGKIYGMKNGIEGLLQRRLIDLSDILDTEEKIRSLERTPAAALGSCRLKLPSVEKDASVYEKIFEIFSEYDIRYFFYIGGNDSMDTAAKVSKFAEERGYDIRIIGIPKTIDNDLLVTDHTPGYGSAAKYVATTVQEIIYDCAVYTTKAVTIVEIMGRDAGWLTAASAVGSIVNGIAPDLVYLPECAFSMEEFYASIEKAFEKHPNIVVAISEGIRFADGRYVCESSDSGATDVFGHKALSGAAKTLEMAVKNKFGCKVRSIELNLPQRCAGHLLSRTDISESVMLGKEAVRVAAEEGVSGDMMIYERVSNEPYSCTVSHKKVADIANMVKSVPSEYINAEGNFVTKECCEYILPLIEGEDAPVFKNGIPDYIVL